HRKLPGLGPVADVEYGKASPLFCQRRVGDFPVHQHQVAMYLYLVRMQPFRDRHRGDLPGAGRLPYVHDGGARRPGDVADVGEPVLDHHLSAAGTWKDGEFAHSFRTKHDAFLKKSADERLQLTYLPVLAAMRFQFSTSLAIRCITSSGEACPKVTSMPCVANLARTSGVARALANSSRNRW